MMDDAAKRRAAPRRDPERTGLRRLDEAQFRLLVESVQDYAIFMLDTEGRVVSWNRGAERINGYTEEEIVGKPFSIFYTQVDRERNHPAHELAIARDTGRYEEEGWRVRKDGSLFWSNVVITALRDEKGRLVGYGKVTRDLTARRAAEEQARALAAEAAARAEAERQKGELERLAAQLQEQAIELEQQTAEAQVLTEELEQTNEEVVRALTTAEAANRAKAEFLTTMSHELRTPLNAILGYVDLMELGVHGRLTAEQQTSLDRIRASAVFLASLVNDVLNFARLEAGRVEFRFETVPLAPLLVAVESLVAGQFQVRGITLEREDCAEGLVAWVDPDKLQQILLNLLTNAYKFTETGGRVRLECSADADAIRIRVRDTGRGIPEDQRETIFDPFVQIDRNLVHASQQGVGLGLSISRDLARGMGGDLTVESEAGVGSTFTLTLPRAH